MQLNVFANFVPACFHNYCYIYYVTPKYFFPKDTKATITDLKYGLLFTSFEP
jgi:hypothetical protein